MATLKQRLHRKNGSTYDVVHLETESNVVMRPSGNTVETDLKNYLPKVQNSDDVPEGLTSGQIVTGNTKVFVCTGDGTIRTFKEEGGGSVPVLGVDFTYTGECQVIDDSNEVSGVQWRIKFLTSGVLVFTNQQTVDLFLVGGGGNGAGCSRYAGRYGSGGGGGAGGYTGTFRQITVAAQTSYPIVIGGSGGASSALDKSVNGGESGHTQGSIANAGSGGSGGGGAGRGGDSQSTAQTGGAGGSDGSNGVKGYGNGGNGQGTTTREFGETGAELYAGGGGGGGGGPFSNSGAGGAGGGGAGKNQGGNGYAGTANTGGGGGGGGYSSNNSNTTSGGAGGSGIAIIRKAKN